MKWSPEHPLAYVMRAMIFVAIVSMYHAWYRPLLIHPLVTVIMILTIIIIIMIWKQQ